MGLETGTLISDLVATNPAGGDLLSQGDDHIRLLKTVVKNDALPKSGGTMTGKLNLPAGTTPAAPLNIPSGVAPSAPVDGDLWGQSALLSYRAAGTTYTCMFLNGSQSVTGTKTYTIKPLMPAATTAQGSITLPHGAAPTAPVNGDLWTTTAGFYARVNGVTVGPLAAGTSNVTLPIAESDVTNLTTDLAAKEPALPAGGTASNFLRGDKTWAVPAGGGGSGDVVGPASTVDNTIPRFDLATGKLIQTSTMTLADDGQFALKSGANTVVSYTTSGTSSSGGLVLTAMPPHGQYLSITPRSDSNGALVLNSGGGFNFDSALSIGNGSAVSNTVSLSRQTSGATHALKVGSGLLNLPHGSAPSAPTNGDLWTDTTGVYWRINGATRQVATNITVASTAPSSPAVNDVWIDTT